MHTAILPKLSQSLAAIPPCYGPDGDKIRIIAADGTSSHLHAGIRAVLCRLAKERAVDLPALKRQTERATGQRILHILPLADDLVLVPVKVRTPQVNGDNCTGYVNAGCVTGIRGTSAHPNKALIILQSGVEVPTLWIAATVEKHLRAARLLTGSRTYGPQANVQPELMAISRKLTEVFQDILALRTQRIEHHFD